MTKLPRALNFTSEDQNRWLRQGAELEPTFATQVVSPKGVVRFVPDPGAFQGWRGEPAGAFTPLAMAEADSVDLDFGSHWVGRLTLSFSLERSPPGDN